MKKIILLGFCLLAFGANAQSVGINSNGNTADPSAILDLESTTKGFLPPRMTQLQMNAIVSPATGLIVYCTNCSPAGLNHFDGTAWSSLTGSATQQTLAANCMANGFTGVFISGSNVSGTHFSVTLTNNSFSATSFPISPSDLVLSGASAGVSVNNLSLTPGGNYITTVNIPAYQTVTVYYGLTGVPATGGLLTGTWTKFSLTCTASTTVGNLSDNVSSTYCGNASTNGFYAATLPMQTTNTFVIAITNNSGSSINLAAPTAANLSLSYSGTASPSLAVGTPTQSSTGALAAGATRTFTYPLTGTPTSIGTLTFNWTYGDLTCTKTREIDAGASNFASTYCNSGALNGTYSSMIALTAANTFTVSINNTSGVTTPTLPAANAGNLTLSGPGAAGLTVTTATPAASTLTAGGNRTYTYTISGTPTGTGTLTATWNYLGMTCSKEVTIPALSNSVSANCAAATTNGYYATTLPMQTTNTFVIAITNTGSTALNLVAPTAANLSLSYSGIASPALAVGTTTQSSTGALAAGATRTFTYRITGTPTSIGTLTFDWAYGDLTCTKTREIDAGASNFASTYCNTSALNGTYASGGITTASNTFTVIINNVSGATTPTLPAATAGNLTLSGSGAAGLTVSAASPAASTLAAGGSRTYTYTISGTITGTGTLIATWNYPYLGMTCSQEVEVISVVSLPNICNPSNPTAVVDVINASTGKVWMDRNLGATSFATNSSHKQSYGSLYQWGRGSDGHQCVNRIEGDGVITSNVTPNLAVSDTPGHGNFIVTNTGNNDWRSPQNNNLWQGVSGTNNPCPTGYRLPTDSELNNERLSWVQAPISSTNDANGAITSPLKLPLAGYRSYHNGYFYNFYEDNYADGYYWSSTVNGTNARFLVFGSGGSGIGAYMASTNRANGFSVRCIKN